MIVNKSEVKISKEFIRFNALDPKIRFKIFVDVFVVMCTQEWRNIYNRTDFVQLSENSAIFRNKLMFKFF